MRIVVFGAAGQTGKPLVEQALASGYKVNAFVHKSGLQIKHENLTLIHGDVTDPDSVDCAVQNANAVISVLNTKIIAENKPITRGILNILNSMHNYGVCRLIMTTSGPSAIDPGDSPNIIYDFIEGLIGFLVRMTLRNSYDDIIGCVKVVQTSDMDWTIVRMPFPSNNPGTGKVQSGFVNEKTGFFISRINAAMFILDELQKGDYVRRIPVIFD